MSRLRRIVDAMGGVLLMAGAALSCAGPDMDLPIVGLAAGDRGRPRAHSLLQSTR